jgi:hypothetical protein
MTTGQRRAGPALVLLALCLPASASGQVGPLVMPDRELASFAECHAYLSAQYALIQATADPAPITNSDGSTIQHLLRSDGVIATATTASLDTHLGTEVRVPLPDLGQIRTSYSYEERSLICTGATLGEQWLSGYYLEGYAPIP